MYYICNMYYYVDFYKQSFEKLKVFNDYAFIYHLESEGLKTNNPLGYTIYSKDVFVYGKKSLEEFLRKDKGFVQQHNTIWRNGFVCIDESDLTIWHHQVSKHRTKIVGNIADWIKYFSRM